MRHCLPKLICILLCSAALAVESLGEQRIARQAEQRVARLLDKVFPTLEKTLVLVDKHEALPAKSLNPFDTDQRSNQAAIDKLLDDAVSALEVSQVTQVRDQIRELQRDLRNSKTQVAEYRRKRIGAPRESELSRLQKVNPLLVSRDDYDAKIAKAEQANAEREKKLKALIPEFGDRLRSIGLEIDDEGVEALLGSISGHDFVAMVTVFRNIKDITLQLQTLTDESGESLEVAKRYYGMYVVLVQTLDRLQKTFIDEVETAHIPKLREFSEQAKSNIQEARSLISSGGGTPEVLRANIASNQTTKKAAEIYIQHLEEHVKLVAAENKQTQISLATAQNTYKTVRLSGEVATLMRTGRRDFDALMQLELPTVRDFGNETIRREFQRMTIELRANL